MEAYQTPYAEAALNRRGGKTHAATLIGQINAQTNSSFLPDDTDIRHDPLPFFQDEFSLLVLKDDDALARSAYLLKGEQLHPFDGTLDGLLAFNRENGLILTPETIPLYMRFYLSLLTGEGFTLIETAEDYPDADFMDAGQYKRLSLMIAPVRASLTDCGFEAKATLLHDDRLYLADIKICPSGRISINSDRILPFPI